MGNTLDGDNQQAHEPGYVRAPDSVTQRFLISYGVRTTVIEFFSPREVTQAQILNREFYDLWIAKVQTRIRKLELPFLFSAYEFNAGSNYFGCFDMNDNQFRRANLQNKLMIGCIQVRLSLFVYDFYGKWTQLTGLHNKETATEKALAAPIFTQTRFCGLANFDDELIFVTGGMRDSRNSESEVFFYDIRSNKWRKAPAMLIARYNHSNTVLGTSLYAYGG